MDGWKVNIWDNWTMLYLKEEQQTTFYFNNFWKIRVFFVDFFSMDMVKFTQIVLTVQSWHTEESPVLQPCDSFWPHDSGANSALLSPSAEMAVQDQLLLPNSDTSLKYKWENENWFLYLIIFHYNKWEAQYHTDVNLGPTLVSVTLPSG